MTLRLFSVEYRDAAAHKTTKQGAASAARVADVCRWLTAELRSSRSLLARESLIEVTQQEAYAPIYVKLRGAHLTVVE